MIRLPALPHPLEINWRPIEPGYWLLYITRGACLVPAKIWLCDHSPYEPENKRDRWPIIHLAGEIAGKWVDPKDIWERVLLRETRPTHWKCAHPLVPKDGLSVEEEYEFLMADLAWKREKKGLRIDKPTKLSALELPF